MIDTLDIPQAIDKPPLRRVLMAHPSLLAIVAIGLAVRMWVLLSPLGALNADEAFMGLQTRDILRGHLPVVIGGASYTGTTDAFLLAPVIWVFGQHVLILKLMTPVFWAAAAVLSVGAARRVLPDRWALSCGSFVWLAPGALLVVSTRGYPAYGFGLVVVAGALWAGLVLVEQAEPQPWNAAAFGATAGLAFYTHPMFATLVGPFALVVAVRHRRSAQAFWAPAVGAALVVNLPFLVWNARNSWPSLDQPPTAESTYGSRLRGFFTGLLPRDLGVRRQNGEWLLGRPLGALIVLVVLALAAFGVWRTVRASPWSGAALTAPLLMVWPLMAALDNLSFVEDGRYGIIVLPVLAIAVASGVHGLLGAWRAAWIAVALAWVLLCAVPFTNAEAGRDLGDPNAQTQALIDAIEREGFDRLAGYYWAILPIEYQSDGRIRVAVAGNPPKVRLPETQRLVESTSPDRLAYLFLPGPIDPTWVKLPVEQYRQVEVAGFVLYLPTPAR
jgi:hypothetical protein